MPYNKTNWQNEPSTATPITAENLNKLETQYDAVVADIGDTATELGSALSTTVADGFVARRKRLLRRFWEKLAANAATVVIPGDSWTEGTRGADAPWLRWVDHLANAIRSASGQALGGVYIPSWATYPTRIPANWTYTGTTVQRDYSGMGFYNVEMSVGATATLTLRGTGFRLHHDRRPTGATIEVRIDGTLIETINTQNATDDNGAFRNYGGLPLASHTLQVTVVAGSGSTYSLQGAYAFNGDETTGVKVYPSGRGGITAKKFFETGRFAGQVGGTNADLVIFGLGGINDWRTGVTIAEYLAAMRSGIQIIKSRAIIADASLVFLQFPQPALGGTTPAATWEEYRAAVATLAQESDGLLIDLAELFTPGQLDADSALVNTDEVHVNDPGHLAIAELIAERILPSRVKVPLGEERVTIPANQFIAQDGTPVQGTVNGTWPGAWRLPDGATTSVIALVDTPPGWGSCAIDILVTNFSVGTGSVRLRSRIAKVPLGGSVSVSNDDYKTHPAKAQYIEDRSWAQNPLITLAPDTRVRITVAREGADAADTLGNDFVFTGVRLRRLS